MPDEPIYRTVDISPIEDFLAYCEIMPEFDASHPEEYALLEVAKAALANRNLLTGERLPVPPTDAEILILRYLAIGPFRAHDEEWPTLDSLVARGLLTVKSGPEIEGRLYEITQRGRLVVGTAMHEKRHPQETANAR